MDAKYLGVTLSNDLEWSKHIATMTNNANSKLSFLRRNLKGCPEKLKQTAYFPDSIPTLAQCWFNVVHYDGPWPIYNLGPV